MLTYQLRAPYRTAQVEQLTNALAEKAIEYANASASQRAKLPAPTLPKAVRYLEQGGFVLDREDGQERVPINGYVVWGGDGTVTVLSAEEFARRWELDDPEEALRRQNALIKARAMAARSVAMDTARIGASFAGKAALAEELNAIGGAAGMGSALVHSSAEERPASGLSPNLQKLVDSLDVRGRAKAAAADKSKKGGKP